MTRRQITKFGALVLALLLSVGTAVACDGGSGDPSDTTAETGGESTAEGNDAIVEELYGKYSYDGAQVRILALDSSSQWYGHISDTANEIYFEDAGSDVFQKAVFERNAKTQKLLDVEIVPVWVSGGDQAAARVLNDANANVQEYEAAILSLGSGVGVARQGGLLNLNDMTTFDSTHDWWNEQMTFDCTLFGTDLYLVTGAINIWDDCSTNVLTFNKDLLEFNNSTVPYQEVFDGTWTADALAERIKAVTRDLNGDQELDHNDSWGIGTYGTAILTGLNGFDSGVARMSADGVPELVVNSEASIEKSEKWFETIVNSECYYEEGINGDDPYHDLFEKGQLGFGITNLSHTFLLRDMEDDYGILPMPKYNAEQSEYTSNMNTAFCTAFAIPKTCADPEMAAACLEVMSGYGVDTLDKSLHEILFESKLTRDEESRQILDIIQTTISLDWGDVGNWTGGIAMCFNLKQNQPFTIASTIASYLETAQTGLDEMILSFEELSFK